ncbi:MAG: ELM1/GtrOC1 family putative glycosyltransferase [Gammaproteobacteria bacterium]
MISCTRLSWVPGDSVSIILEVLTAGCQVGLVVMPRLRKDRITTAVDRLIKQSRCWSWLSLWRGKFLVRPSPWLRLVVPWNRG